MKDSQGRSILKTMTWRVIATITTFILAYTIFSNTGCPEVLEKSTMVAGLELVTKLTLYYFHERGWQLVKWGRPEA
ncbi:MAG: DUF2061 domain-containing protein [Bacteroidetes bacterium]|nr:DUF2061 domain-containing protein [Bacteroidota bacterium]